MVEWPAACERLGWDERLVAAWMNAWMRVACMHDLPNG